RTGRRTRSSSAWDFPDPDQTPLGPGLVVPLVPEGGGDVAAAAHIVVGVAQVAGLQLLADLGIDRVPAELGDEEGRGIIVLALLRVHRVEVELELPGLHGLALGQAEVEAEVIPRVAPPGEGLER